MFIFYFQCFKSVHVPCMSTETSGKGHRKLRLCSRKHYERKKYKHRREVVSSPTVFTVSVPLELLQFRVSIPLSVIESAKAETLHNRLVYMASLPPRGIYICTCSINCVLYGIHTYCVHVAIYIYLVCQCYCVHANVRMCIYVLCVFTCTCISCTYMCAYL